MPTFLKVNTLLSAVLAATFYFFFMFAKHDPALSAVIPFMNDPYDAVGSFAAISSILLVLIAVVRTFRPYRAAPTEELKVYLARTQMAIALAALITLGSDLVAMVRYAPMWLGTSVAGELIALLGVVAVGAVVVVSSIHRSMRGIHLPRRTRWLAAVCVSLVALLILAVYPESLIHNSLGGLFTIVVGMLLLFAPLSVLDIALIPFVPESTAVARARWQKALPWLLVLLVAFGVGVLAFLGEASREGAGSVPLARVAMVFAVFVGVGTVGIVTGYAFLRKPLGFLR
jgi:hypothetical protein